MVDSRLPLEMNNMDTATPVRQANRDQWQNSMNHEQVLSQYYQNMDAREKSRLSSVISGAVQLKPYLDNDDLDGAHEWLMRRRSALQSRMGGGENIDTEDTDAAIQMIRSGDIDGLKNSIAGLMAAGQVYGILGRDSDPANVKEWQYYNSLTPEQKEQYLTMKRSNQVVNLGGTQMIPSQVNPAGAPQAFYNVTPKPEDMPDFKAEQATAVANATNQANKQNLQPKAYASLQAAAARNERVLRDLQRAKQMVTPWATGTLRSQALANLPGTAATDLRAILDTVKANIGFDELNSMRQNSPTGGALGSVTERELAFLQNVLVNLEQSQSVEQLNQNLDIAMQEIQGSWDRVNQAYQMDFGNMQQGNGQVSTTGRIRIRDPQSGRTGTINEADWPAAQAKGYNKL